MTFTAFLIKYAEIGIKGKNRFLFEDALMKQIRRALRPVEGEFTVSKTSGRIYVQADSEFDYDEALEALQRVFGIAGICPLVQIPNEGYEDLAAHVVSYMDQMYPDKKITFKVDARRTNKSFPRNSMELNADLGEEILKAFPEIRVDVHHPDVMLHVELRENIVNI